MSATVVVSEEFEPISCGECGVRWCLPIGYLDNRRRDGATFYCPNGHARVFRETEADRLRQERDRLKQENARLAEQAVERWRLEESARREAADRRASAARGQVTKLKNRASAGVCPCCNRTFKQLAAHMATKHPGFTAEPIAGEQVLQ